MLLHESDAYFHYTMAINRNRFYLSSAQKSPDVEIKASFRAACSELASIIMRSSLGLFLD